MEELKQYFNENLKDMFQCEFDELDSDSIKNLSKSMAFAFWKINKAMKELAKAFGSLGFENKQRKYKIKFDRINFSNRWKQSRIGRGSDWTIIGISEWWCSPTEFCYKICFFGLDLKIWFSRIFSNNA